MYVEDDFFILKPLREIAANCNRFGLLQVAPLYELLDKEPAICEIFIMEKIISLDVGDKYIGVAISDDLGLTAQGLEVIKKKGAENSIKRIKVLIENYFVKKIIIGLPKKLDNTISIQTQKVIDFTDKLKKEIKVPVIFWDERFTTGEASRMLIQANVRRKKRREVVDIIAAQLILQGYLTYLKQNEKV